MPSVRVMIASILLAGLALLLLLVASTLLTPTDQARELETARQTITKLQLELKSCRGQPDKSMISHSRIGTLRGSQHEANLDELKTETGNSKPSTCPCTFP